MRNSQFIFGVSGALFLLVGCGGDDVCRTGDYPGVPAEATDVLHVSAGCSSEGADGSAARPFPTIREAVGRASVGATVLIAPGTYAEELSLSQDISLIGSSDGTVYERAAAVIDARSTVLVTAGTALLRGLRVVRPKSIGIWARGGSAIVEGSQITDALSDESGNFGYGVVASENGSIILQHSAVTGSVSVGVLVKDAGAIILQNNIEGNQGGGLRVEQAMDEVTIDGNTLVDNVQFGVSVLGSRAIILQNMILGTRLDSAGIGDGLLVSGLSDGAEQRAADVTVIGNELHDNQRVGILCSGEQARGIILQNNVVTGSGIVGEAPAAAGIWLQAGAGSGADNLIASNQITGSKFVGIGLTGDTHSIILQNNTITDTVLGASFEGADTVMIGDGINLFNGASATMTGNTAARNSRFGLIVDSADGTKTSISDNTFNGNEYGIILQNQNTELDVSDNTTVDNVFGDTLVNPRVPFATQKAVFATSGR